MVSWWVEMQQAGRWTVLWLKDRTPVGTREMQQQHVFASSCSVRRTVPLRNGIDSILAVAALLLHIQTGAEARLGPLSAPRGSCLLSALCSLGKLSFVFA
jgi:hypothetical protein